MNAPESVYIKPVFKPKPTYEHLFSELDRLNEAIQGGGPHLNDYLAQKEQLEAQIAILGEMAGEFEYD